MSKLAFLKTITVVADEQPKKTGGGGIRKEWNPPSGLVIRIWKDGSVFPSQELVNKFQLEYLNAVELTAEQEAAIKDGKEPKPFMGYGFDVADTKEFKLFQAGDNRFLIISVAPKNEGRVDLFGTVTRNEKGIPVTNVMNQGSATFGKEFLIPRIEEIYGLVFAKPAIEARAEVKAQPAEGDKPAVKAQPAINGRPAVEGLEYVDMVLIGQEGENSAPWTLPEGKTIAFFPKIMTKGEAKGQLTTQRRENPQMYIFYPKPLLETEQSDNGQEAKEQPATEAVVQ